MMPIVEEHILVERYLRGDRDAFAALMDRYQTPLYQFAWRILGDAALAQDATQEAFARAWIKRARYRARPGARFSTWLFQLARHAALDALRRRREASLDELTHEPRDPGINAAEAACNQELSARIAAAFAALPEAQRAAVTLSEYHGLRAREIARVLRCSTRAAESHIYRGKQRLHILLADCWAERRAR
jgi:RNA polymerase sigma-70 factor (ECF subfamily)